MNTFSFKRAAIMTFVAISLSGGPFVRQARATPSIKGASPERYTVRHGNSLWRIARQRCGDPLLWKTIADANGISDTRQYRIYPGQILSVPCSHSSVAVIQKATEAGNATTIVSTAIPTTAPSPLNDAKRLPGSATGRLPIISMIERIRWRPWWFVVPQGIIAIVALLWLGRPIKRPFHGEKHMTRLESDDKQITAPAPACAPPQGGPLKIDPNEQHEFSKEFLSSLGPWEEKRRIQRSTHQDPCCIPHAPESDFAHHEEVSTLIH